MIMNLRTCDIYKPLKEAKNTRATCSHTLYFNFCIHLPEVKALLAINYFIFNALKARNIYENIFLIDILMSKISAGIIWLKKSMYHDYLHLPKFSHFF